MARLINSAPLLAIALATGACSTDGAQNPEFIRNTTLYSENQPVVQRTDYVIDLATSGDGIPGTEKGRLADWFDTLQLRYGDAITIDDGYGSRGVREDVAQVAATYGLLVSNAAPVTAGIVQPGTARVIVSRASASVPGCPNWRYSRLPGSPTSTDSNYGCAMNSNLAAMIANPNDLVLGQEGAVSGDAATSSKAIKSYRDTAPTGTQGLEKTTSKGGN